MKDFYSVLGVDEKADAATIKKAFRKLAREFHPDKNPDDPAAEKRFKEIQEAYDTVGDAEKRKQYDIQRKNPFGADGGFGFQTGPSGGRYYRGPDGTLHRMDDGGPGGGEPFGGIGDLFNSFFGGRGEARQPEPERSAQEMRLRIPFDRAIKGGKVKVKLPDGSSVQMPFPKGVKDGYKVKLKGKGPRSIRGATDLYIVFAVGKSTKFVRSGNNVTMQLKIDAFDAMLGITKSVANPYGKQLSLKIPEGTQHGSRLRLKGQGIETDGEPTGDLYVEVQIEVPTLTAEQKERLKEVR